MLDISLEALENFISQMGASVGNQESSFDPYQASISSTTGVSAYTTNDPTKHTRPVPQAPLEKVAKPVEPAAEEVVCPERNPKIFSKSEHCSSMSNLAFMQLIESTEPKPESEAHALVKILFDDGYVLQGVFDGQEKLKSVAEFVKDNLNQSDRQFVLFETPPKRVLSNGNKTLKSLSLVPTCRIYFEWSKETEADGSGTILNIEGREVIALRSKFQQKKTDYLSKLQELEEESKLLRQQQDLMSAGVEEKQDEKQ